MQKIIYLFLCLFTTLLSAQDLPVQTFGDSQSTPIIFLHGGPGYNSVAFEQTTADALAKNGFFVISYDRRGEGRNVELQADYNFVQTLSDLTQIYQQFKLDKAVLLGHSFGGIVATLYAEQFPNKVSALILVSTPVSMQDTFATIISKSKAIYTAKEDKTNLNYISMLESMDKSSLEYAMYSFMHAMTNGFYSPKQPTQKATELYQQFRTDPLLKQYGAKTDRLAPQKFWENEQYTTISLVDNLQNLNSKGIEIFVVYGVDDGLFSAAQVADMQSIIGKDKVETLDNASHNVFIDRQTALIELLKKWSK